MNSTQKLASIDFILSGVPEFKCIEGCSDCCGPVPMSRLEWKRILETSGRKDKGLYNEMIQATRAALGGKPDHGKCPLLDKATNKCSVYEARPAICRVFGASENTRLVCPHGRRPEKLLTDDETGRIVDAVAKLGY